MQAEMRKLVSNKLMLYNLYFKCINLLTKMIINCMVCFTCFIYLVLLFQTKINSTPVLKWCGVRKEIILSQIEPGVNLICHAVSEISKDIAELSTGRARWNDWLIDRLIDWLVWNKTTDEQECQSTVSVYKCKTTIRYITFVSNNKFSSSHHAVVR